MPALSPYRAAALSLNQRRDVPRQSPEVFRLLLRRPLLKRYIRRIHGRICVSNAARDFVSHYFPGDYRIIPNGVDVDAFRVQRPLIPELNDGKLTMLFVGRLEKRKGLVYLLRALPYVQHHFPQLRLIVVGAFDEEDMREYRAGRRGAGPARCRLQGLCLDGRQAPLLPDVRPLRLPGARSGKPGHCPAGGDGGR